MEMALRDCKAVAKVQNKDELDELFEWGAEFAKVTGITKEKSRELLRLARKVLHNSGC